MIGLIRKFAVNKQNTKVEIHSTHQPPKNVHGKIKSIQIVSKWRLTNFNAMLHFYQGYRYGTLG